MEGKARTRSDLISHISYSNRKLPPPLVKAAVKRIFSEIIDTLANGDRVELRGFGSFEVHDMKVGGIANPRTGDTMDVEAMRRPYWRASKSLLAALQAGANA